LPIRIQAPKESSVVADRQLLIVRLIRIFHFRNARGARNDPQLPRVCHAVADAIRGIQNNREDVLLIEAQKHIVFIAALRELFRFHRFGTIERLVVGVIPEHGLHLGERRARNEHAARPVLDHAAGCLGVACRILRFNMQFPAPQLRISNLGAGHSCLCLLDVAIKRRSRLRRKLHRWQTWLHRQKTYRHCKQPPTHVFIVARC
jgi:hypothetical protein